MNKTWWISNSTASGSSHGSLTETQVYAGTTSTGWTVGTTSSANYSLMQFNAKKIATSFGSTQQPSSAPSTNDCWRTSFAIKGIFIPGIWTFSAAICSSSSAATGSGKLYFRLWKSSNATGSGASEITSQILSGSWSNVTTSQNTIVSATSSFPEIYLNNEYLFFQIAIGIDSASANASSDIIFKTDFTYSKLISPELQMTHDIQEASIGNYYTADVTRTIYPIEAISVGESQKINYYTMRAKYQSSYITWQVSDQPDTVGSQSGVNPTDLSDIVVINTKTVII